MEDLIQKAEYKACSKCDNVKVLGEFHKDNSKKDGLSGHCKECVKDYAKQYYRQNSEKLLDYGNKYREENNGKIRYRNKWYYHKNREIERERKKEYRQTSLGRAARLKNNHKYRALKAGATAEDFSPKEVFIRDKYICQSCGVKTRPDYKNPNHAKFPNLDHIIPLSIGGEHSRCNTQCLCRKCNLEKGNRHANDQMLLIG